MKALEKNYSVSDIVHLNCHKSGFFSDVNMKAFRTIVYYILYDNKYFIVSDRFKYNQYSKPREYKICVFDQETKKVSWFEIDNKELKFSTKNQAEKYITTHLLNKTA